MPESSDDALPQDLARDARRAWNSHKQRGIRPHDHPGATLDGTLTTPAARQGVTIPLLKQGELQLNSAGLGSNNQTVIEQFDALTGQIMTVIAAGYHPNPGDEGV